MSEQIIINGVDVAKCCYYDAKNDKGDWCDLTCTREHAPYFRCESMPNCYYKQLQILKQEKLIEEIIENCPERVLFTDGSFCKQTDGNTLCSDCTDCYYKQLQCLKQENNQLKADNCRIHSNLIQQLEYEKKALEDAIKLKQENEQLNLTLEEISETEDESIKSGSLISDGLLQQKISGVLNDHIIKDCPSLDSDGITCQDCTQDDPGFEACINRNNCIIKKLILRYDSISDFNQNMKEITKGNEQLKKQLEFSRTHKTVLDAKRIKYKQTLEAIKEIASDALNIIVENDELLNYVADIRDKIDEVLNER